MGSQDILLINVDSDTLPIIVLARENEVAVITEAVTEHVVEIVVMTISTEYISKDICHIFAA